VWARELTTQVPWKTTTVRTTTPHKSMLAAIRIASSRVPPANQPITAPSTANASAWSR
jgi:hypothetical protein